jgi:hypothetical protein
MVGLNDDRLSFIDKDGPSCTRRSSDAPITGRRPPGLRSGPSGGPWNRMVVSLAPRRLLLAGSKVPIRGILQVPRAEMGPGVAGREPQGTCPSLQRRAGLRVPADCPSHDAPQQNSEAKQ